MKELSERSKLNLLILDDEILYVHKNIEGTLFYLKNDSEQAAGSFGLTKGGNIERHNAPRFTSGGLYQQITDYLDGITLQDIAERNGNGDNYSI